MYRRETIRIVYAIFGFIQAVIGVFWYQIAEFVIVITKWDDAGMIIITCPVIVFFLIANILTEIRLKNLYNS